MSVTSQHAASVVTLKDDRNGPSKWGWTLLLVCAAATAVVAPTLFLGSASGHDVQFHVASWIDVLGQWREGTLFPRWAEWANWGFGEPRFIFYPPASWLLGAALGAVLPWEAVTGAFAWIALAAAGMSAWRLARDWMPGEQAAAAAVFYAANPYNVAIVYYRSDFAELLAVAIFPLLVCSALRLPREGWNALALVALPFAGIWLSNAPAAVILTYSLCLLLIAVSVAAKSWKPAAIGSTGMTAGFALAAIYILPAAWEQRWVQIQEAAAGQLQPVQNFLFVRSADTEFRLFNWKMSFLAVGMILVAAVGAALCAKKRKEHPAFWWTLAVLGVAGAFMMISPSAFLWKWLPKLQFVQFPWRWLEAVALPFALFAAMASPGGKIGRRAWLVLMAIAIVAASFAIGNDAYWDTDDVTSIVHSVQAGKGYEGTDEYAPLDCDRDSLPPEGLPIALLEASGERVAPSEGEIQITRWTGERVEFQSNVSSPETLALRRLNYPAWKAKVDGREVALESAPDTGEIELEVPAGTHYVEIRFARTWDRTAGGAISLVAGMVLAGFEFGRRRPKCA